MENSILNLFFGIPALLRAKYVCFYCTRKDILNYLHDRTSPLKKKIQVWRRLTTIQLRAQPGLMRLAASLQWPLPPMVGKETLQVEEEEREVEDNNVLLFLEEDGDGSDEDLEVDDERQLEIDGEDSIKLEMVNQGRKKNKRKRRGGWRNMLYMITNYPGADSIHSPVKVILISDYPDFRHTGDHWRSLLSSTPAW